MFGLLSSINIDKFVAINKCKFDKSLELCPMEIFFKMQFIGSIADE